MREAGEALGHQRLQPWPPASIPSLKAAEMCMQPSWMAGLGSAHSSFSEARSCQGSPDAMSRNGSQAADEIRSLSLHLPRSWLRVCFRCWVFCSFSPARRQASLVGSNPCQGWEGVKTQYPPSPPPRPATKASRLPGAVTASWPAPLAQLPRSPTASSIHHISGCRCRRQCDLLAFHCCCIWK